ncbi:glutathione S-transferase family protein [Pleurocapsa sp. PCC 7319]|uniref:glutathione S-transferase family protein n=1 Tax=Pleurocapsa sp. PCC 7319 TaxID=118161 RepID=UPI00034B2426|nr:glutathione S-transferase family protein [Pleurocapsa sp. PCC 7319]
MLEFYYHPLSPLSRRVWIALLEKKIPFKSILVNIQDGEQFKPDFLALNPFHHVPVIVDDGLRVIESLAILDYLESKYRDRPLLPQDASQLAKVRMAQMVSNNELSSLVIPLMSETEDSPLLGKAKRKINRILHFFAELLADNAYFGGENLSLGDIVAGNAVVLISKLDFNISQFEKIEQWCDLLMEREVWQTTQPNDEQIAIFKQTVQKLVKLKGQNQIIDKVKQS